MQQIDALMHSRIANLFFACYGRRNAQEQCGAGQHTNNRTTGGTAERGMRDTIGYTEASGVSSGVTNSIVDYGVHQYAWYRSVDEYGGAAVTQVNNICCLGYEDIYGHKWEMMDGVDLPNDSNNYFKWRIWMPDGSIRMVKSGSNGDWWITAVAHGKYMDVVPVGNVNGSSSTYYSDKYWTSSAQSRVVYRGYDYANAMVALRARMRLRCFDSSTTSGRVWPSAAESLGRKAWPRSSRLSRWRRRKAGAKRQSVMSEERGLRNTGEARRCSRFFSTSSLKMSTFVAESNMAEVPIVPCGLSRQQQRECEWWRYVLACE